MMIRALGEYQRSIVLWCVRTATWEEDTYIFRVFIQCTLCNDDILQWICRHKIMFRAVQRSSPQHSRHSSLLKQ